MRRVVFLAMCVFTANGAIAVGQYSPQGGGPVPANNFTSEKAAVPAVDPNATVLLKLSIIEVSVTKLRRQGTDFEKLLSDNLSTPSTTKQKPAEKDVELFAESLPGSSGCFLLKQDDRFFSIVKKLIKDDMAKIRAQPNLVTSNGRTASFLTGGEIPVPVPVPQSAGATTIEWKKYGMQVDFVPVVLDQDTLKLEIRARLSELDENQNISVGGTTIPGIAVHGEMDTGFKIKTGQVAVISGERRSRAVRNTTPSAESKTEAKHVAADSSQESYEEFAYLVLIKPEIAEPAK